MEKTKLFSKAPIGVFDSGLGGLTVLKSLEKMLPKESFIYFGDTAHVPYGTKSTNTVLKYSKNIIEFFLSKKTKAIVIACNTASAVAFNELQGQYTIPLFDVVTPSVELAIKESKTKYIGVIGTTSTINSKAYSKLFYNNKSNLKIYEEACPLFVPIIEEGWANTQIATKIAKVYLEKFNNTKIDKLILGCTHYPIMANTIKKIISNDIELIFSGKTVGEKLYSYLSKNLLLNNNQTVTSVDFYVSDFPQKFDELGSRFLGRKLNDVKQISLD